MFGSFLNALLLGGSCKLSGSQSPARTNLFHPLLSLFASILLLLTSSSSQATEWDIRTSSPHVEEIRQFLNKYDKKIRWHCNIYPNYPIFVPVDDQDLRRALTDQEGTRWDRQILLLQPTYTLTETAILSSISTEICGGRAILSMFADDELSEAFEEEIDESESGSGSGVKTTSGSGSSEGAGAGSGAKPVLLSEHFGLNQGTLKTELKVRVQQGSPPVIVLNNARMKHLDIINESTGLKDSGFLSIGCKRTREFCQGLNQSIGQLLISYSTLTDHSGDSGYLLKVDYLSRINTYETDFSFTHNVKGSRMLDLDGTYRLSLRKSTWNNLGSEGTVVDWKGGFVEPAHRYWASAVDQFKDLTIKAPEDGRFNGFKLDFNHKNFRVANGSQLPIIYPSFQGIRLAGGFLYGFSFHPGFRLSSSAENFSYFRKYYRPSDRNRWESTLPEGVHCIGQPSRRGGTLKFTDGTTCPGATTPTTETEITATPPISNTEPSPSPSPLQEYEPSSGSMNVQNSIVVTLTAILVLVLPYLL